MKKNLSQGVKKEASKGSSASAPKKKKPYKKITLEKHSDMQLWAFGTMGG